jgi:predicted ATPase
VARLEKYVSPDGGNLVSVLHTLYEGSREFKQEINSAMCAAFGDDFEEIVFPPAADQRIQMRLRWRCLESEQSIGEMSYGTLRFLFVLAILANPEPPPLVALDEPELGLHPRMMAILAEYAVAAAERSQVVIATHSPEFLDAFPEPPSVTVLDWDRGKTVVRQPSAESLQRWLAVYRLGEVFRSGELEGMA